MNIQDIYELMDRFDTSAMAEVHLEMEGVKVLLKKTNEQTTVQRMPIQPSPADDTKQVAVKKEAKASGVPVEAPLVGTFYSAPSPEEAPFVSIGSKVKKGDVVGIIEAMKLMNEITAPCDGTVEAIEIENGQMVEFHQVLMRIS